jgi:sporulation protein YlmC with PRC-barrel domain
MLRRVRDLERCAVLATDGKVGTVDDLLFDDQQWGLRHFVVKTGNFFDERRALVSPLSISKIEWPLRRIQVALTMDKIRKSPDVDTDKPVSRQYEIENAEHYGYGTYWGPFGVWDGNTALPAEASSTSTGHGETPDDVHLRSANELRGYHVQATDGAVGHVADFVLDDQTWTIRNLVIDTRKWWHGRDVLISPAWMTGIRWAERTIDVRVSRREICDSPVWGAAVVAPQPAPMPARIPRS